MTDVTVEILTIFRSILIMCCTLRAKSAIYDCLVKNLLITIVMLSNEFMWLMLGGCN